jgi:4-hydroxysphinganine ceramide fatty acyl 2-hydroxylase
MSKREPVAVRAHAASGQPRFVSNHDVSCRMFKREWLERLSHVHPLVPHVIFVPVIVGLLLLPTGLTGPGRVGWFLVGVATWTLTEYLIHRFLFHPPPQIEEDTRELLSALAPGEPCMPALPTWRHRFYFLVHGVHHDFPSDSTRLVMPPSVSVPLAALFFLLFRTVIGAPSPITFAGFIAGYLFYDTTHYLTHRGHPRTSLGRVQRRRHFRHHYADSSHDYGVTSPLWDVVLGTMGRNRQS